MAEEKEETPRRLSALLDTRGERRQPSRLYTRFIRMMRLLLPVLALILVAVLFIAPEFETAVKPLAREEILPGSSAAQNELLKPRYESVDKDSQPFTVTADKATQSRDNPDIIMLQKPTADLMMKDGRWVAGKSDEGVYEQKAEKLLLKGNVRLYHDTGYELQTPELRINLNTQQAFSDQDVTAQGPEGTLSAIGLEADGASNILVFKGPATLVLNDAGGAMNFERAIP